MKGRCGDGGGGDSVWAGGRRVISRLEGSTWAYRMTIDMTKIGDNQDVFRHLWYSKEGHGLISHSVIASMATDRLDFSRFLLAGWNVEVATCKV